MDVLESFFKDKRLNTVSFSNIQDLIETNPQTLAQKVYFIITILTQQILSWVSKPPNSRKWEGVRPKLIKK